MSLGQVEQAVVGDTNKCFYQKASRPRFFYAEPHQFIIGETLVKAGKMHAVTYEEKKMVMFVTEAKQHVA